METTLELEDVDKDKMENETIFLMYGKQNTPAPLNGVV